MVISNKRGSKVGLLLSLVAGAAFALTGPDVVAATPLASTVDLSGATLSVGSKEFTEQLILGNIAVEALKAAGAKVDDQVGLAGSTAARNALTSGQIDMYWDYTGTVWVSYLKHETAGVTGTLFDQVAKEDLEKNGIRWTALTKFSNSYGIVMTRKEADATGLHTLDDMAAYVNEHKADAMLCTGAEFAARDDGLRGMEEKYGFKFDPKNVIQMDFSLVYTQVANGKTCQFASVYDTDGRIPALNLVELKDTKHYFPPYYAALNIRNEVFEKYPQLEILFVPIANALNQETMQHLNAEVDVDGKFPEQVAKKFLVDNNFIAY